MLNRVLILVVHLLFQEFVCNFADDLSYKQVLQKKREYFQLTLRMKEMDMDLAPRTWGGARKGSGRKATGNKGLTFQASREIVEIVEQQPNKSRFLGEVVRHGLDAMCEKGLLTMPSQETLKPIELVPTMMNYFDTRVAAGTPLSPGDIETESVDITSILCEKSRMCYIVTVKGNSMIEMGILDGDKAVIDATCREVVSGKPLLCEVNDEYTIKMVELTEDGARLIPANKDFEPIVVRRTDRFRIMGRVMSVIHRL